MSDQSKGYAEQTRVRPHDRAEVYGQDGFGWYAEIDVARELAERSKGVTLKPGRNPLFIHLAGMTGAKLRRLGFVKLSDD